MLAEMNLLWLLLPVAAMSGWWIGQSKGNSKNDRSSSSIYPEYFKGLNFVLNEQPDKAIEVFIRMLEVDSETVETHLALGNLFRRRGEVESCYSDTSKFDCATDARSRNNVRMPCLN